jgi:peptidoglycan/xylan/chitin deacetylase (PgdA/CDA1 family)
MIKKYLIDYLSKIEFVNRYYSGIGAILMLHRVAPFEKDRLSPNENMKVSPEFLEIFIELSRKKGYTFISLDELYEILTKRKKASKILVLTFDDGYKDNYEIAYPLLKSKNIPFTIYITTSFLSSSAILWWYMIEEIILEKDYIELSDGERYSCKNFREKEITFLKIREKIIKGGNIDIIKTLKKLFSKYDIDWLGINKKYCEKLCLSVEDIKKLSQDTLVTIGSHTKNHYPLSRLSKDKVYEEITAANKELERLIHRKIEHFAYPFGSHLEAGDREFNIVKELGFKTATTARRGTIYYEHANYLYCLPRIMLVENFKVEDIGRLRGRRVVTL